jgi:AraC-like DNA-binding protein
MKLIHLTVFLLLVHLGQSQNLSQIHTDSLTSKSYKYLEDRFDAVPTYDEAFIYAIAILRKAKGENNLHKIIEAHELIAYYHDKEIALVHADSIQMYSKKANNYHMEEAFIVRGYFHQKSRHYTKAIENYTKAYPFAVAHDNKKGQFKIRYNIANIDKSIGDYKNAQQKLNECYLLLRTEAPIHDIYKINVLLSLATVYEKNKIIDSSYYYTNIGIEEAKRKKLKNWKSLFHLNEGILLYHEKEFKKSIKAILEITPALNSFYLSKAYYYLGTANHAINNTEDAVHYFMKMDSLFHKSKIAFPEAKTAYHILLKNFEKENALNQAYLYSERLRMFDSLQYVNFKHLNNKIIKGYNIPNYKQTIVSLSKTKKTYKIWVIITLFIILIFSFFLVHQYRKQKLYKKRFEELVIQHKKNTPLDIKPSKSTEENLEKKTDLPQETIDEILRKLKNFEDEKVFLRKDITLNSLAKKLNTNHTYLSRVINLHENKGFVSYINDLRIDYALHQFVNNKAFKKYTVSAIAEECGFNSSRSFSRAFHRKTGLQTSYFIKQLEN